MTHTEIPVMGNPMSHIRRDQHPPDKPRPKTPAWLRFMAHPAIAGLLARMTLETSRFTWQPPAWHLPLSPFWLCTVASFAANLGVFFVGELQAHLTSPAAARADLTAITF